MISNIKVVEKAMADDNIYSLHTDGTSREGEKLLVINCLWMMGVCFI